MTGHFRANERTAEFGWPKMARQVQTQYFIVAARKTVRALQGNDVRIATFWGNGYSRLRTCECFEIAVKGQFSRLHLMRGQCHCQTSFWVIFLNFIHNYTARWTNSQQLAYRLVFFSQAQGTRSSRMWHRECSARCFDQPLRVCCRSVDKWIR